LKAGCRNTTKQVRQGMQLGKVKEFTWRK